MCFLGGSPRPKRTGVATVGRRRGPEMAEPILCVPEQGAELIRPRGATTCLRRAPQGQVR